jgi:uncharacterized iron-regulated protein
MTMPPKRADRWLHSPITRILLSVSLVAAVGIASPARAQLVCPSASQAASPIDAWLRATNGHPLVGNILYGTQHLATAADACSPSPLAQVQQSLADHLADGGILLLGEVHDNGAQHALRGHILAAIAADLARRGRPAPALVFEHIRTDQVAAFDPNPAPMPTPANSSERARDLLTRLQWEKTGWPAADLFMPIFEAAMAHALPILPGHPTRAEVRDVARRGLDALPKESVTRLGLDAPLPDPLANALLDELEASHCGLMPRSAFANMALAQRYRDAHLAASLTAAAARYGAAILFAGNGHVRTDRGVPWALARLAPERKVVAVALIEVETDKTESAGYVPVDPQGRPAADYVVLTPRTERPDPCDAMRARFKKK